MGLSIPIPSEVVWPFVKERVLFRTHQAPFQAPQWAVGALVELKGSLYRVTSWRELRPITLDRGGTLREWEVRGRKASGRQVREELARGAESLLLDEDTLADGEEPGAGGA